jgi:hypothetical protein
VANFHNRPGSRTVTIEVYFKFEHAILIYKKVFSFPVTIGQKLGDTFFEKGLQTELFGTNFVEAEFDSCIIQKFLYFADFLWVRAVLPIHTSSFGASLFIRQ